MRILSFIILILLSGLNLWAQEGSADDVLNPTYDYDTTLKAGYSISFKVDDELQYLYLKKGSRVIAEIASVSKGELTKTLGYKGADFTGYFVLVHSHGGGNPHYIELIKKSTGKNILKNGAAWIDADEKREMLLFCDKDVPGKSDKMILLNIRTGQKQLFAFPADIFTEPQVLNRIKIRSLTSQRLVISYETEKGVKVKTYNL
ncbi:MAG: hypothetical protein QM731_06425 [Chitinophagaceae bacterium]